MDFPLSSSIDQYFGMPFFPCLKQKGPCSGKEMSYASSPTVNLEKIVPFSCLYNNFCYHFVMSLPIVTLMDSAASFSPTPAFGSPAKIQFVKITS